MPERLLLTGRAGSGKTWSVLARAAEQMRLRRGPGCLLFLPTQGQVDHVRGHWLRQGIAAFRDDFAHTFFTFARSLARDLPDELLSAEGERYLLGDLLRQERLPAFAAVRDTSGFRELLGQALKELKENGVTPEDYPRRILDPLGGEKSAAPRHRDLGRALAAYERLLRKRRRLDADDLLLRALRRLESDPGLLAERRLLLVDGFHDFTPVQFRILSLLSERIPESLFTLSFDADRPGHPAFQASTATRRALLDRGFREEALKENHRTGDPTLRRLEAGLFAPPATPSEAGEAIRIARAARREDEAEGIARSILRLVREKQVPYGDIAVLYRDPSEAGDLLEGTFRRFGIPLRVAQPKPMARQPLIRFLLDLGGILARGPDRDTLLRFLRSGHVVGLEGSEVDRLDQSLREDGAPENPGGWLPRVKDLRLAGLQRVLGLLGETASRLRGEHGVRILASGWLGACERLALPLGEEGVAGAEECAAWEAFRLLVDEAGTRAIQGKGKIPLALLLQNVEEGAAEATFRVRDRRREVVNVINAREARQWEVPYLFVAGVLERQFPPAPVEGLFFDDDDRRRLQAAGLRCPHREAKQAEERFLFYTAVTRARHFIQLSYPAADSRGNPALPSFFLREVQRLFSDKSLQERTTRRLASAVLPPPEEIASLEDVDRTIFLGLEERLPAARAQETALAAALYNRRLDDDRFRERLGVLLEGTLPRLTDPGILGELAAADVAFSNSALTAFLQCPYLHFVEKWLRLQPLPGREMEPLDLGNVIHDVLKEYFEGEGRGDPLATLDRRFREKAAGKRPSFRRRAEYGRLRRALESFLPGESERNRRLGLTSGHLERSFGTARAEAAPAVTLEVEGRRERLSGKIDRIDLLPGGKAGVVVDYKYSSGKTAQEQRDESLGHEGEIRRFQLAIYLLALAEAFGIQPAGAELVALRRKVERFGIGRRAILASAGLDAAVKEDWGLLDEDAYRAFLERARSTMAALVKRIRSGEIVTDPDDLAACGPGECDAADICRYDRWLGQAEE